MPIRDKVRRAMRRSAPSPSTSPSSSTSTVTSASGPNSPETKLSSRFANLSLTRRNRSSGSKSGGARKGAQEAPDPREKPFTEMNLRYQEIFEEYTLQFGASRRLSEDWEAGGISPMTSRRNSLCE